MIFKILYSILSFAQIEDAITYMKVVHNCGLCVIHLCMYNEFPSHGF